MTKNQVENLVDKLADKTLSFGCEVVITDNIDMHLIVNHFWKEKNMIDVTSGDFFSVDRIDMIIGHPVMIGDVMNLLKNKLKGDYMVGLDGAIYFRGKYEVKYKEIAKWEDTTKSLQQIVEESVFKNLSDDGKTIKTKYPVLKNENARNLFEFLNRVFNENPQN